MGLREELSKEMGEAAQRIPLVLEKTVYGTGQSTDDPVEQIKNVLKAHGDLILILSNGILRLADEIDALKTAK